MPRIAKSNPPKDSAATIGFETTRSRSSAILRREITLRSLSAARDNRSLAGDQVIANRVRFRTLATLRDTLLPKLLSGELSVTERR